MGRPMTVEQRIGEDVVSAWVSRAPERASTERRGAPRDSTKLCMRLRAPTRLRALAGGVFPKIKHVLACFPP